MDHVRGQLVLNLRRGTGGRRRGRRSDGRDPNREQAGPSLFEPVARRLEQPPRTGSVRALRRHLRGPRKVRVIWLSREPRRDRGSGPWSGAAGRLGAFAAANCYKNVVCGRPRSAMGEAITLRVAEAFQQDIGLGTARLDVSTRQRLKVGVGDIVEIRGRKTTAAVVNRAQQDDEGKGLIRVEAVVRRNAGVSIGDRVSSSGSTARSPRRSRSPRSTPARPRWTSGPGLEAFVSKALSRRPFVRGDVFVIPGCS